MTVAQPPYVDVGGRYPQLPRTARWRWWRPLLGLLICALTVVVLATAVVLLTLAVSALIGGPADPREDASLTADRPLGLLANNLVIATLVPASMLAVWAGHGQRPGYLASVTSRPRSRLFGQLLVVALVLVVVFVGLSLLIPPVGLGSVDPPAAGTLAGLLAVIALSTPLQSAAEEIGFRGYLTQAVASWFARPVVGAVVAAAVSALAFAFAHGAQDPALFVDRCAFGLVASWLTWRTGGLEAAIALHVANNLVSLGLTAVTGSVAASLEASSLDWPHALVDVVMMLVYALVVARLVDRRGVQVRRVPPPLALSAHEGVGYPGSRSSTPPPAGDEPPWGMG
ncbi:MAG: protease family protein [Actinomycetota bacterium]|nr:protease family protein [Actinomycetota bacterium]